MKPLVSVITPTWQRQELLVERCIPSVQAQAYPLVEHVVVSDGPAPELRMLDGSSAVKGTFQPLGGQDGRQAGRHLVESQFRVVFHELGEHTGFGWGTVPRLHGIQLARGDIIAYLDDDNAFRPNHLAVLVDALLEHPEADFAYSQAIWHPSGGLVGSEPPAYCQIDTSVIVHRRRLLDVATWRYIPGQVTIDWDLVERWLQAGARWVFVPEVTVDYFAGAPGGSRA